MKKVHEMKKSKPATPARISFRQFFRPFLLEALSVLGNAAVKPTLAYKIAKIGAEVETELERFQKLREKILEKYGRKDDSGKLIVNNGQAQILPENLGVAGAELEELAEIEFEVSVRLTLSELELEGVKLTGAQLTALGEILNPEA